MDVCIVCELYLYIIKSCVCISKINYIKNHYIPSDLISALQFRVHYLHNIRENGNY